MRLHPTATQMREALLIFSMGLIAMTAVSGAEFLLGVNSPFKPGVISAIVIAVWVFLIARYAPRPRQPADPQHRRISFLWSIAAVGAAALGGLVIAMTIGHGSH